jgi:hypothetical protein
MQPGHRETIDAITIQKAQATSVPNAVLTKGRRVPACLRVKHTCLMSLCSTRQHHSGLPQLRDTTVNNNGNQHSWCLSHLMTSATAREKSTLDGGIAHALGSLQRVAVCFP